MIRRRFWNSGALSSLPRFFQALKAGALSRPLIVIRIILTFSITITARSSTVTLVAFGAAEVEWLRVGHHLSLAAAFGACSTATAPLTELLLAHNNLPFRDTMDGGA